MAVYTRTYRFKNSDGLYYHENRNITLDEPGWSIYEGDTIHPIANILSITAKTTVNRHNSSSSSTCSWSCRLTFSNGISITSNVATGTISSAGSNSSRTVSFSNSDVELITTSWDSLTTVTSIVGGGSWTNWAKHPLYLTITFNDELYVPAINNFSAARYKDGIVDSQEGTEVRLSLSLTTESTTTKTDKSSYIKVHYTSPNGVITTIDLTNSISTINSSWLNSSKSYTLTGTFSTSNSYDFILEFCYYGEIVNAQYSIGPGFCNFYLSSLDTGGVSIGKRSSATLNNPLFECSYPSRLKGINDFCATTYTLIGGNYYQSAEILTGGRIPQITDSGLTGEYNIYQKIIWFAADAHTSDFNTGISVGTIKQLIDFKGVAYINGAQIPLNSYFDNNRYIVVWIGGIDSAQTIYLKSSWAANYFLVLYYTKN